MNKAVHALVYVILVVAGVALYFEMKLFEKKELLTDSNEQLRKCIVDLSSYIEAENAPQGARLLMELDEAVMMALPFERRREEVWKVSREASFSSR